MQTIEEADEIRSGQEVAEAPHQLSLLQHLCGSSSDASDAYRLMQSSTLSVRLTIWLVPFSGFNIEWFSSISSHMPS